MSYDERQRGMPEQPRSEPEIIPPQRGAADYGRARAGGADEGHPRGATDGVFVFIDERGGQQRIHVGRPSPFSFILAFLIGGLILAGVLLLAFSMLVVVVPVIAVAAAGLIAYAYLRGTWRRLRSN